MSQWMSFDAVADCYDATRTIDAASLDGALNWLVARFPPERFSRVCYPGIGTGRLGIPLAERGYQVDGVDVSAGMLAVLGRKLAGRTPPLAIRGHHATATALPFADASCDLGFTSSMLHLIVEWRLAVAELIRAVRPEGAVVLMGAPGGLVIPALTHRYIQLCRERLGEMRPVGVQSLEEVIAYLAEQGWVSESVDGAWEWRSRWRVEEVLDHYRARAFSFTASPSDAVHGEVMAHLEREARAEYGSLAAEVEVTNRLCFNIASRA